MAGDEHLFIGGTLGRFHIQARLGRGGMGVVYRARDPQLDRDVALKMLVDDGDEPSRRARFLREARAAAALAHPSIAAIYDVGFDEATQTAYIAMELIDGKDLRSALKVGPLPVVDVERIAIQAARGIARGHAAHVVHRDLKPENVMLTVEGDAKILDFRHPRGGARPGRVVRRRVQEDGRAHPRLRRHARVAGQALTVDVAAVGQNCAIVDVAPSR